MKKLFALTLALTAVTGLTLFAGPTRYDSKDKEVTPLPACDFSGLYIGGNIGVANYEFRSTDLDYFLSFDTLHEEDDDVILGSQIGYNWQKGAAVYGLESDFQWSNMEAGRFTDSPQLSSSTFSQHGEVNWFGTVRGRIGMAYENVLVYLTAGGAYAQGDREAVFHENPSSSDEFVVRWDVDDWRFGWTGGVGVEVALNCHWSIRAETLYVNFEDDSTNANLIEPSESSGAAARAALRNPLIPVGKSLDDFHYRFDDEMLMVRFAINYRFGRLFGH